jgi:hypothetical protein
MQDYEVRICAYCQKEFELTFGLTKWCSAKCKWAHRGRPLDCPKPGRPRRFPKAKPIHAAGVANYLRARSWNVREHPAKNRMQLLVRRGWYEVKMLVGGDSKKERWADVIAYIHPEWHEIRFASACVRRRNAVNIPQNLPDYVPFTDNKTKQIFRRSACNKETCKKCAKASWFKHLLKLDNEEFDKQANVK